MDKHQYLTHEEVLARLALVDGSKVARVYSGKPGYACRGKHSENKAQITRVLNLVKSNPDLVEWSDGHGFRFWSWGDVFSIETDTRLYIVYTKKAA